MDNYTPNSFMTQPIYDPTRPFATPSMRKTPTYSIFTPFLLKFEKFMT